MDKQLIDHVWKHCLPKEFKEEVKDCYKTAKAQHKENFHLEVEAALIRERIIMLEYFFGFHNLTSDSEGEDEMLCVSRKQVQEIYKTSKDIVRNEEYGTKMYSMHIQVLCVLESLFGSKCLPEETKQETNSSKNENTSNYSGNHFAGVSNMFDTRLHIAAMVMAGALANKNVTIGCGAFEDNMEYITKTALMYADALIAECESSAEPLCPAKKGGNQ